MYIFWWPVSLSPFCFVFCFPFSVSTPFVCAGQKVGKRMAPTSSKKKQLGEGRRNKKQTKPTKDVWSEIFSDRFPKFLLKTYKFLAEGNRNTTRREKTFHDADARISQMDKAKEEEGTSEEEEGDDKTALPFRWWSQQEGKKYYEDSFHRLNFLCQKKNFPAGFFRAHPSPPRLFFFHPQFQSEAEEEDLRRFIGLRSVFFFSSSAYNTFISSSSPSTKSGGCDWGRSSLNTISWIRSRSLFLHLTSPPFPRLFFIALAAQWMFHTDIAIFFLPYFLCPCFFHWRWEVKVVCGRGRGGRDAVS